jgi:hypothetical protein
MKCAAAAAFIFSLSLSPFHSPHSTRALPVACISGGAQNVMLPAAARFFMHKITSLLPKERGARRGMREANTRKIEINYLCALSARMQPNGFFILRD